MGTVLFNFDPGGWRSLDRPPISAELIAQIKEGKVRGRIPKRLVNKPGSPNHSKTFRDWFAKGEKLENDQILILDYESRQKKINVGLTSHFESDIFIESSTDLNFIETKKDECRERGISYLAGDSLTWWQWAVLGSAVIFRGPTKMGWSGTDQDIYGKAIEKMKEVLDVCCHLPFTFVYTAHVQTDQDTLLGRIKEEISIYGKKLPELIASMTDDIFFCNVDMNDLKNNVPRYTWSAHPQGFLKAMRTRSFDNLAPAFDANFQKLYKGSLKMDKKSILLIGPPGTGKTVALETLED